MRGARGCAGIHDNEGECAYSGCEQNELIKKQGKAFHFDFLSHKSPAFLFTPPYFYPSSLPLNLISPNMCLKSRLSSRISSCAILPRIFTP